MRLFPKVDQRDFRVTNGIRVRCSDPKIVSEEFSTCSNREFTEWAN
jgi:hypothetical protein